MATGTAGANASTLQTIGTNQRATAASLATVPKDQPDGKKVTMTASGNASATAFTVAHGLSAAPTTWFLTPTNAVSGAIHWVTADATNLTVTFAAAPAAAANNVTFVGWAFI